MGRKSKKSEATKYAMKLQRRQRLRAMDKEARAQKTEERRAADLTPLPMPPPPPFYPAIWLCVYNFLGAIETARCLSVCKAMHAAGAMTGAWRGKRARINLHRTAGSEQDEQNWRIHSSKVSVKLTTVKMLLIEQLCGILSPTVCTRLRELSLHDMVLESKWVKSLYGLSELSTLSVTFTRNYSWDPDWDWDMRAGLVACYELGKYLDQNEKLTSLNLGGDMKLDEPMAEVIEAALHGKTLRSLSLRATMTSESALITLTRALQRNVGLERLLVNFQVSAFAGFLQYTHKWSITAATYRHPTIRHFQINCDMGKLLKQASAEHDLAAGSLLTTLNLDTGDFYTLNPIWRTLRSHISKSSGLQVLIIGYTHLIGGSNGLAPPALEIPVVGSSSASSGSAPSFKLQDLAACKSLQRVCLCMQSALKEPVRLHDLENQPDSRPGDVWSYQNFSLRLLQYLRAGGGATFCINIDEESYSAVAAILEDAGQSRDCLVNGHKCNCAKMALFN
jgi:hypothetical protein